MNPFLCNNPFVESRLNTGTDFRPEWDIPELNRFITDHLVKQTQLLQGRVQPDPGQKIQILLAPPGFGKTHLFGRVCHNVDDKVLFVYVPAFEDVSKALEHIRRHVVEALFREHAGRPPLLHQALARLCQSSLIEYVSQFPPSLAAKHQSLLQALQAGSDTALSLVQSVKALAPFHHLAVSIAGRLKQLPFPVVYALALGWSPLGDTARRWLRGDSLPKEDLGQLHLPEDAGSASPLDVLRCLAPLLRYQTPIILCCDQMEMVLQRPDGPNQVTAQLIEILHQVPMAVLVLGCLQSEWPKFLDKSFTAFQMRVAPSLTLRDLTEAQAVHLIELRMKTWEGYDAQRKASFPFDESSIITYVRDHSKNPRVLIQRCADLFADWLAGDRTKPIYVTRPKDTLDPAKLFLQMWNGELESITKDPTVSWSEYPEDRLYRAVREVLALARDADREMAGVRVRNVSEGALRQRGHVERRAFAVDLTVGGQNGRVIVPVTTVNNGHHFRFYFEDIELALAGPVIGCLLVHRQAEFQRGGNTAGRFDSLLGKKKLRVFALDENPTTLQRLHCLLRFLDSAEGQLLQIDDVKLSYKDCQDYVLKTAVLDNLDLLKVLGGWHTVTPVKTPAVGASAPLAAAASISQESAARTSIPKKDASAVGEPNQLPPNLTGPKLAASTVNVPPSASGTATTDRSSVTAESEAWAREKLGTLVTKLKLWGLPVNAVGVEIGPSFARLKIEQIGRQTTFNRVRDKTIDLKIQLGLRVAPLIDSQPNYISVDVELPCRRTVTLMEALAKPPGNLANRPVFPAGVDVAGQAHWLDLSDTSDCHLLVAGQTGSGKSEFLRAILAALAMQLDPGQLKFVLIDPKRVTFNLGELESPYLDFPVCYEAEQALPLLEWCMEETRKRYELLAEKRKTNVGQLEDQTVLPRIIVVIDEFADLLTEKETKAALNGLLKQIGAIARAAGIHLVLATQRPDKDVVTPLLKANLPGKIALRVANEANSKLIIGDPGAVCLLGKGDLLWQRGGGLLRLQSPYVTQAELEKALRVH